MYSIYVVVQFFFWFKFFLNQCKTPDSLEHTFLQCSANVKFYHEILSWFNVSHNTLINLSPEQILMQKYIPSPINDNLSLLIYSSQSTRSTNPVY